MFAIEKNIPPPAARTRTSEYNFHELQIGDSICIPGASYDSSRAFWAAQKYFARNKKKITSKKENDGIRIWRIE